MYEIILFDLDDTLVDFVGSEKKSLQRIHHDFFKAFPYETFEEHFKSINAELWRRVVSKVNALKPGEVRILRFEQLILKLPVETSPTAIAQKYEEYLGEYADWLPKVKPAIEFLHQKGHILGIVTNGLVSVQDRKYQRLELANWFDCFIVSDRVGVSKPHKDIFTLAFAEISTKRFLKSTGCSMLMVGDSLSSDGVGAKNFGIDFCHVSQILPGNQDEVPIKIAIQSVAKLPLFVGYHEEYPHYLQSYSEVGVAEKLSFFSPHVEETSSKEKTPDSLETVVLANH